MRDCQKHFCVLLLLHGSTGPTEVVQMPNKLVKHLYQVPKTGEYFFTSFLPFKY